LNGDRQQTKQRGLNRTGGGGMKEPIEDLLRKIAQILHFLKLYEESKRLMLLAKWLVEDRPDDFPEDI
jgi:hypothetical protein